MNEQPGKIDEPAREKFEAAWLSGIRLPIAFCIESIDPRDRIPTLAELVLIDIEFSWKTANTSGEQARSLESYVKEFPELASPDILQKLLEEEYLVRKRYGDSPRYADFEKRFPGLIDSLDFTEADATDTAYTFVGRLEAGAVIDRFKLIKEIGEGGMGRVFVAQQSKPVQRQVALKVIKKGMNSKQIIARFNAERQALAMMNHQNIARILDGGTTTDGQPYFVMELVNGIPLTEYCDKNRLKLKQRLRLFNEVCAAVQHAHQKGIIHRDLKPSNILVAENDGQPIPKVIDFGLAKALDSNKLLTDQTMETHIGQVLGTYKYMSPEQADSDTLDVDTRADVYALGVILYELLTGSTPIDQKTIQNRALHKILELIRDHDPPRPSIRLSSLNESASTVSDQRQMETSRLSQVLRGDLDWVVMKALEKDRARRYETAASFSDDINRFLNNEPVIARPPSAVYRFQKRFRKHRLAFLSAAALVFMLIAGITGTTFGLVKANQQKAIAVESSNAEALARKLADEQKVEAVKQKQEADRARNVAEEERKAAEIAKKQAQQSRDRTKRVLDFVVSTFRRPDPSVDGRTVTIASVLENALNSIDERLNADSIEKSSLLDAFGKSFTGLGLFDLAIESHKKSAEVSEKSWGKDSKYRAAAITNLAYSFYDAGQLDKSKTTFAEALRNYTAAYGSDHSRTLTARANMSFIHEKTGDIETAVKMMESVYKTRTKDPKIEIGMRLKTMTQMILAYKGAGELEKRLPLAKLNLELAQKSFGLEHAKTISPSHNYAVALHDAGRYSEALEYRKEAVDLSRSVNGELHPETNKMLGFYARELHDVGQSREAVVIYEQQVAVSTERLGADHPTTLLQMNNLGGYFSEIGEVVKSMIVRKLVYETAKSKLGETHPDTLTYFNNYALAVRNTGRFDSAMPLLEELYELRKTKLGEEHPDTIGSLAAVGLNNVYLGNKEKSISLLTRALESRRKRFGERHSMVLFDRRFLGFAYLKFGEVIKAIEVLEPALADTMRELGESHPDTLEAVEFLAAAYGQNGDEERALAMLENAFETAKKVHGIEHTKTIEVMKKLALAYGASGKLEASVRLTKQMLDVTRTRFGEDHPAVYMPLAMLSMSYINLGQFPEAIEPTQQSLQLLIKSREPNNIQITRTRRLIGQLLLRTGKFDEAGAILQKQIEVLSSYQGEESNMATLKVYLADVELQSSNVEKAKTLLDAASPVIRADKKLKPYLPILIIVQSELFSAANSEFDNKQLRTAIDEMMLNAATMNILDHMYVIRGYQLLIKLASDEKPSAKLKEELVKVKAQLKWDDTTRKTK